MRSLLRTCSRVLTWVGVLLILLVCIAGGALWLTLPPRMQEAEIEGLSAPVEIGFDQDGIPRIRAANALDAATALGFVHARDRMFQMELMRRNASGRLSELAGPATLPLDRMARTLGLRRRAVADLAVQPADTRAMLEAYARGVNAWIEERGRFAAPEFLLLGAPDPWTAVDSLLWGKTMGLWLSENWHTEMIRHALAGRVEQSLIDTLWPTRTDTIPPATAALPVRFAALGGMEDLAGWLPRFPAPFTLPSTASNEWAVDGRHTATGAPLLAGDPHLALGFPSIWYLARIELPDQVLAGATAPGVPFLVLGRNGRIAWTFTSTGADVQDVFVETPAGPGSYQTPDGPQPFMVHEERIKIRGEPDEVLTVRETRHGPVISDLRDAKGPILAVAMANLQPDDTAAAGLLALNRAGSVEEAGRAAALITAPVQNLAVADHERIGLFLTGRVPVRKAGDGSAPVPGDGSHDWIGWLSGDALPHVVAPESGRIVNGNEPVRIPGNDAFLGRDAFAPWRARRIRTLLDVSDRHTAAGFARMQADVTSSFAQQILPALLAVPVEQAVEARAQALLRGWDATMRIDQPQPLIFNTWVGQFYRLVLAAKEIRPDQGGPQPDFVAYVLTDGRDLWCGGDCTRLLQAARTEAIRRLRESYGGDPAAWRWGTVHQAIFAHPMLRHLPIVGALTTAAIAAPGDDTTIDRGETNAALQDVHGPAYRGVYDLADLDSSLFVMTPGQSGNPLSRHARDFLTRWRDGATVTLGPTPKSTEASLRLIP